MQIKRSHKVVFTTTDGKEFVGVKNKNKAKEHQATLNAYRTKEQLVSQVALGYGLSGIFLSSNNEGTTLAVEEFLSQFTNVPCMPDEEDIVDMEDFVRFLSFLFTFCPGGFLRAAKVFNDMGPAGVAKVFGAREYWDRDSDSMEKYFKGD